MSTDATPGCMTRRTFLIAGAGGATVTLLVPDPGERPDVGPPPGASDVACTDRAGDSRPRTAASCRGAAARRRLYDS